MQPIYRGSLARYKPKEKKIMQITDESLKALSASCCHISSPRTRMCVTDVGCTSYKIPELAKVAAPVCCTELHGVAVEILLLTC